MFVAFKTAPVYHSGMVSQHIDAEITRLTAERQLIRDALRQQRTENATNVQFEGQGINRLPYEMLVKDEARLTNQINDLIVRKQLGTKSRNNYMFGRRIRV